MAKAQRNVCETVNTAVIPSFTQILKASAIRFSKIEQELKGARTLRSARNGITVLKDERGPAASWPYIRKRSISSLTYFCHWRMVAMGMIPWLNLHHTRGR